MQEGYVLHETFCWEVSQRVQFGGWNEDNIPQLENGAWTTHCAPRVKGNMNAFIEEQTSAQSYQYSTSLHRETKSKAIAPAQRSCSQ